ncbi:glycosyl hydrolase family 43 protein [Cercophora samala]|uniref:Glycosyl hydrolase family 43 protein n=1 Tax=Cercophora samala TaxID=330535 RepID=A0AA39ZMB8_9PEZI|nr:glycosyl hydrolase family 43 protein [Cercophora samala]
MRLPTLISLLGLTSPITASLQIVPGGTWTASNNEHLNAHGAGLIQHNNRYYLIGEDKSNGTVFQNINCYSSSDLVQWRFEGALLSQTPNGGDIGPNRIVERPKVIYNDKTGKFVMWLHIDNRDYSEAKVGVAVSDTVCGRYRYLRSFRPLGFESRDMGLFKDDDGGGGQGYLLTEDRRNGLRINRLTDDFLDLVPGSSVHRWNEKIESPALIKHQGRYYMFGSKLTGWDPNDNVYSHSTSLSGGWSSWQEFADDGSNTYHSQTTYILPYGPYNNNNNKSLMYMGDRWVSTNLQASTYIWLPLEITGTKPWLKNRPSGWVPNLDPATGTGSTSWAVAPASNTYPAASARLSGSARSVTCNKCASNRAAVGYIGGAENGSLTVSNIRSDAEPGVPTTIQIRYTNGDKNPRYAIVTVNGQQHRLAFQGTAGDVKASVLHVQLKKGSNNEIVVAGPGNGGWGPDVEGVVVPLL